MRATGRTNKMLGLGFKEKHEKKAAPVTAPGQVVKVIEVIGTSPLGFEDAIRSATTTAAHSLRHVTGADVKHLTVALKDGEIVEYRVDLKLAFALEDDDEEDDD
jgi:flavin-binding protein dodecin